MNTETNNDAIILYPTAARGHLVSMVELAKFILSHYHRPPLTIHILTISPPYDAVSISNYIASVSSSITPSIVFHSLPPVSLPTSFSSTPNHETLMFEVLRLNNPNFHDFLISLSKTYNIRALIADSFCFEALTLASKLQIPAYCFFTSPAACLAAFLYFPTIHRTTDKCIKDLNNILNIPGIPPLPSGDMIKPLLERSDSAYHNFLNVAATMPKTAGIIVNTFEALEHKCLREISDGLCVSDSPTPPIYTVGPLIAYDKERATGHECLRWLDSQPERSVVFLCFGSLGVFSKEQLREIACGLERSGQRFLWVVRNPPSEKIHNLAASSQVDPDLDSLLTEGFLDRTRERAMVVKKWAPQVAVLNHGSVGGFVTHCGWNSVLEAVVAGVPMVAWPLYAEQRLNRMVMVEELKIALWMHEEEGGVVTAEEVEERVRELMESEIGEIVRKRVGIAKEEAEAAIREGGSSRVALANFFESWKN
ncbi:UDP-glycosyltransferase 88A1-like [Prosopis cineraria]|uniref:UDP-glycosyltransferase 88A1-like n=1 Tax=Prosopis cineraria TaxID=364024 RepID=UPI00240EFB93|nr:UDP-glycosyltransferase 88A1-like [Prosopis cineraria]